MNERIPLPVETVKDFVIACHARIAVVTEMLDAEPKRVRASIDWGEGDWENGLEAAGHVGNRGIAELLLSRGMSRTIFSAAMMGEAATVERLLATDPSAISAPGVHGISLIYHVAISGDIDIADICQACGEAPGKDDAIHPAVKFGHTDMVAWLIENGARDLSRLNFQGKTPLEVAVEGKHTGIENLLKKHGAK
jgi:ankyrin repeat protein